MIGHCNIIATIFAPAQCKIAKILKKVADSPDFVLTLQESAWHLEFSPTRRYLPHNFTTKALS